MRLELVAGVDEAQLRPAPLWRAIHRQVELDASSMPVGRHEEECGGEETRQSCFQVEHVSDKSLDVSLKIAVGCAASSP